MAELIISTVKKSKDVFMFQAYTVFVATPSVEDTIKSQEAQDSKFRIFF